MRRRKSRAMRCPRVHRVTTLRYRGIPVLQADLPFARWQLPRNHLSRDRERWGPGIVERCHCAF